MKIGVLSLICACACGVLPSFAGDLNHAGNAITFQLPPDSFTALSYLDRVKKLAEQARFVIHYAKGFTGCTDLTDILSRLKAVEPHTIVIQDAADSELARSFRNATRFSTNLVAYDRQEQVIRYFLDMIQSDDPSHSISYDHVRQRAFGFSESKHQSASMTSADSQYLERSMIYRDIAAAQGAGAKAGRTATEKLESLLDWTFLNASNHFERIKPPHGRFYDYNDRPLELMLRGMGSCDRSVWVLTTLAFHAGFDCRLVELFRESQFVSFHTVAEVKTEQGWQVVDPYNNIIFKESAWAKSKTDPAYKRCSIFLNPIEPQALLPMMKLYEMLARMYIPDQRFYLDVQQAARTFVRDHVFPLGRADRIPSLAQEYLTAITEPPAGPSEASANPKITVGDVSLGRWDLPFWVRGYYSDNLFKKIKDANLPFLKTLRPARLHQLAGRYDEADRLFESIKHLPEDKTGMFHEELDYYRILNRFYKKDYSAVEQSVAQYRQTYPDGPRNTMLLYILAHSLEQTRRHGEAVQVYPKGANFEGRGKIVP